MESVRLMRILRMMTPVQTSEVARLANDENKPHPLEVSPLLRHPRIFKLALTHGLLINILQHPSRTLLRLNHHLIASRTLVLMVDLVERQPRKAIVDQSNPLVTYHLVMERYAFRQEKLLKSPTTTKMTMTCLMMKPTWSLKSTGRLGRRRMHLQSMRC